MDENRQECPALTHIDEEGRAKMVDIGEKPPTRRQAVAEGFVKMKGSTLDLIVSGKIPKGDVLQVARIAGICAAKKSPELIPLCHPIRIDSVSVDFEVSRKRCAIQIRSCVKATDRTGVEIEALTAVLVAALTVYDMCKAVDREMEIESVRLISKSGGRSGEWKRKEDQGLERS